MSAININTNAARLAGTTAAGNSVTIENAEEYTAGNIVGGAATAVEDALWTFPKASVDKWKSGSVVGAILTVSNASFAEAVDLHLFTAIPAGDTTGNAALELTLGDMDGYLGKIEFDTPSSADTNSTFTFALDRLTTPFVYQTGAANALYGLLVSRTTWIQGGSDFTARVWLDVERW